MVIIDNCEGLFELLRFEAMLVLSKVRSDRMPPSKAPKRHRTMGQILQLCSKGASRLMVICLGSVREGIVALAKRRGAHGS